ncbi:MAG: type I methionyl aminopeptidase [Candidatus Colwellbacteria bacterium]|nr:type I methionyl aminopeptidase [Candidatus Colwellbacteria bacterium]
MRKDTPRSSLMRKSATDIKAMRRAGEAVARIRDELASEARPGVVLREFEAHALSLIAKAGGRSAFMNYRAHDYDAPYPAATCLSLNDEVVHGLPRGIALKKGDLFKIDIGLELDGWIADTALTVPIGEVSADAKRLTDGTRRALEAAIDAARLGNRLGDIGAAIEEVARQHGLSVIDGLTGHGIGRKLHEQPTVWNFGKRGTGIKLEVGMTLAIEPMMSVGSGAIRETEHRIIVTADRSLAAHFEHTIAITSHVPMILTDE